jgi:plastocyanin
MPLASVGRGGMVSRPVLLAALVVAILAVSAGYYVLSVGGNSKDSVTVDIEVTNGTVQNGAADAFSPRNFTVVEGQHVTVVFENNDDNAHELVIPQFGVSTGIVQGGSSTRVNFVPTQAGTFDYFEPQGVCGSCTGAQETSGNMTVLPQA